MHYHRGKGSAHVNSHTSNGYIGASLWVTLHTNTREETKDTAHVLVAGSLKDGKRKYFQDGNGVVQAARDLSYAKGSRYQSYAGT